MSSDPTGRKAINPQHVVIRQEVRGSDIPVHLMYVEMVDGVYAPIGLRMPAGDGPFPLILCASGNGGGGMAAVQDATQNRSWTLEQFLDAGYAVAWLRYRAEVDYAYDRIGKLIEDCRQNRQLLNRGPARVRRRHRHHQVREDTARHRSIASAHRHEPRRRDGVQDRLGISRRARDDRKRAGRARVPAAQARCDGPHQSGDRPVGCRAHADARAGKSARADQRGCRASAHRHDPNADFVQGRDRDELHGIFQSATTCWSSSARRPNGRATRTTSTASFLCRAMTKAHTRPMRWRSARCVTRSTSSTATCATDAILEAPKQAFCSL